MPVARGGYLKNKPTRKAALLEISEFLQESTDFCVWKSTPHLMPALSFARVAEKTYFPNLVSEAKLMLKEFSDENPNAQKISVGHYEIYLPISSLENSKNLTKDLEIDRYIELILNGFLLESLVYQNSIEDRVSKRVSDISFNQMQAKELNYDALSKVVSENFRVNAEVFRLHSGDKLTPLCADRVFPIADMNKLVNRARHSVEKGRVIEVDKIQVQLEIFKTHTCMLMYLFPIRSASRNIPGKSDFMAVTSLDCDALSDINIKGIDRCVDEYLYSKTRIGQQDCLFWQTDQLTKLVELHDVGSDHDGIFQRYLQKLGKFVLRSTQGHSFSYLEYNANKKALERTVFLHESPVDESKVECMRFEIDPVSIKNTKENLSAYIFINWANHKGRYVYVPNIRDKKSWSLPSMKKISCKRNEYIDDGRLEASKTISEVAMVLQDQEMPIGVVCVESPYSDGLNFDLLFLRQIINNAAVFWSFLFRMSDQMWLRRNLQLQDISHNLSKLAMGLKEGEAKSELSELSLRLEEGVIFQAEAEHNFEERVNQMLWREAGRSEFLLQDVTRLVRFFSPERHKVPILIQSASIQIVRDLLRNRRHANKANVIRMATRDEYGGAKNVLVIRTSLEMQLTDSELRDAFRRPIRRTHRDHVGLYMVGVIARTWGGRLDFDRSPGVIQRNLEICIPFGATEEQILATD